MHRQVAIVAVLIAAALPAQAQQRYDAPPSAARHTAPLSFRDRFVAANTTGGGCLTLDQAQRGLPGVVRQFHQIDTEGRGCVTLAAIVSFRRTQNTERQQGLAARFAAANTTNDGCLTRRQAQQGLPRVAKQFDQIDAQGQGCVTLAAVTAFLHGQAAQQPPPQQPEPQPAQQPQQPPSPQPEPRSQRLSLSDRFAAANTTNDGCLTLEQAQQGLPSVAKDFAQMDAQGHGCLTLAEIKAFWLNHGAKRQDQPDALPKDIPPPPTGY